MKSSLPILLALILPVLAQPVNSGESLLELATDGSTTAEEARSSAAQHEFPRTGGVSDNKTDGVQQNKVKEGDYLKGGIQRFLGSFDASQSGQQTRALTQEQVAALQSETALQEMVAKTAGGYGVPQYNELLQSLDLQEKAAVESKAVPAAFSGIKTVGKGVVSQAMGATQTAADAAIARAPTQASLPTKIAQTVAQNYPDDPAKQSIYGQWAVKDGLYAQGREATAKAIRLGDKSPETLAAYAGASYHLGDYAEARKAAAAALKADPSDKTADAILKLSEGKTPKVRLPSAMDGLGADRAKEAEGTFLGGALDEPLKGRAGRGESAAEIAARENAHVPASAAQRSAELAREAGAKLRVKDFEGARAAATKALEADPDNAGAYLARSMASSRLGDYRGALRDADAALRLAPENPPSLVSRALANNRLKEYPPALEDSDSALEHAPRDYSAHLMRAYALEGLGRREEMLASLRQTAAYNGAYEGFYQRALQLPAGKDGLALFDSDLLFAPTSASAPGSRRSMPWWPFALAGGAGLLAFGLLRRRGEESASSGAEAPSSGAASEGVPSGFEVLRPIGAGGMGEVYEGRDVALDRRVAIKRMREELRRDPRERERFLSEARLVAKLRHPSIVEIYSVLEAGEDAYLLFEFVEGRTLTDLLAEKGRLSFAEARRVVSDVCSALDYAHSQGVIHRDLKPANVMLEGSGAVKVMDFGIARQAAEAMSRLAMTGTVVGTPPYMAPEQEGGVVCKESDVYALGVCLYELLCGERPFAGSGAGMLMAKTEGRFTPVSQRLGGAAPAGLDEVLAKALAPKPEDRYRSAGELAAALARL